MLYAGYNEGVWQLHVSGEIVMPAPKLEPGLARDWNVQVRFPSGKRQLMERAAYTYRGYDGPLEDPTISDYIRALVKADVLARKEELGFGTTDQEHSMPSG